ncbi:fungal-specific transcription factor domain-containing protein [Dendryphion nanum]|uniref:Fungal-specific transcription factor domain-containing protein n=1 Tax=Dendryphion nanum TaxID=256645 RepID=A0A9P9D507_9PLEO|nr:fungal-specific transcription factor domain-containing protein [Dendryphion nanum]
MVDITANSRRQCWSCFKRRIVCDFGRPGCKKCQAAGIDCPGYSEKKPLKWLEPGKVTSKTRTKRSAPSKTGNKIAEAIEASIKKIVPQPAVDDVKYTTDVVMTRKKLAKRDQRLEAMELEKMIVEKLAISDEKYQSPDAEFEYDYIPRWDLRDETSEVVQAVHFYNVNIYPFVLDCYAMAPSQHIIFFPLNALPYIPPAISHSLVSLALGFRFHRHELRDVNVWSKVYHHRGIAIRDISEKLEKCELDKQLVTKQQKIYVDMSIASILVFLCAELQQCATVQWRHHLDGMSRLIKLRGGLTKSWSESPHLQSAFVMFIMITTFANATSPAADHISIAPHLDLLEHLNMMYDDLLPYCLCPSSLFQDIVCINHLRSQLAKGIVSPTAGQLVALELLMRIDSFSPEEWAKTRDDGYEKEFILVGEIYQAATILYCILSLQDASLLHPTPQLHAMRSAYSDRLFEKLDECFLMPRISYFMTFPVIVAGVAAKDKGSYKQAKIEKKFEILSSTVGSCSALLAGTVIRRFWASRDTGWEDCFEKAYAFTC